MKNIYLPRATNDNVFVFIGDADVSVLIVCGLVFGVVIALVTLMIRKKKRRK